ncbi:MAG TPA: PDZ domain-containing protein, partial [Candidatus Acidoferrum sp.]|nr:PDZ domain-containing protein [Candidatus Acidoferrum sp.]
MTSSPLPGRRIVLVSAILAFILILMSGGMALYVMSDPGLKDAFILPNVALQIQRAYVEPLDADKLIAAARNGMFERLDRYSYYIDKRGWEKLDEELSGGYVGIGVSVVQHDLGLMVLDVREKGPAATAGIWSGDIITKAGSLDLKGLDPDVASNALRGP